MGIVVIDSTSINSVHSTSNSNTFLLLIVRVIDS